MATGPEHTLELSARVPYSTILINNYASWFTNAQPWVAVWQIIKETCVVATLVLFFQDMCAPVVHIEYIIHRLENRILALHTASLVQSEDIARRYS
jgi:hypothetical protein